MAKRVALGVVAVFICWAVVDFVMHGILLQRSYAATADLWRPMAEIKMGLTYIVTFISCLVFVLIYSLFFGKKGMGVGLAYGGLFGLGGGISTIGDILIGRYNPPRDVPQVPEAVGQGDCSSRNDQLVPSQPVGREAPRARRSPDGGYRSLHRT